MIFMESEVKADKSLGNTTTSKSSSASSSLSGKRKKAQDKERQASIQKTQENRQLCASTMLQASHVMSHSMSNLWKRGVPDENVISLPCRIAYQMLENSSGAIARKLASADMAMEMIAYTLNSTDCILNTVVSALIDMLHSYEHMAPLVAELCCLVQDQNGKRNGHGSGVGSQTTPRQKQNQSHNKLAVALLREIGRLDASTASVSDTSGKASGIRNVAPFLNEIAEKLPHLVLEHITLVLPHLRSEPYNLRSAIVVAIGHLLIRCNGNDDDNEDVDNEEGGRSDKEDGEESDLIGVGAESKAKKVADLKKSLYNILLEHVYDVSSYTRVAVMKTWATLIRAQSLPVDKLIPVTELAIDRLKDKTVMVRRSAMQVS
jgi:condensin complex subunit 1